MSSSDANAKCALTVDSGAGAVEFSPLAESRWKWECCTIRGQVRIVGFPKSGSKTRHIRRRHFEVDPSHQLISGAGGAIGSAAHV